MNKTPLIVVVLFVFCGILLVYAFPQLRPELPQSEVQMKPGFETGSPPVTVGRTMQENVLSFGVLLFGLLFAAIMTIAAVKLKSDKLFGMSYLKLVGLTLIITAGLFLICAGYTQDQIAPMVGLLGTLAGYLLGKSDAKEKG